MLFFTQSLDTGELPRDWSLANVAPIFKKGNRVLAENYRPVSLTCITCKLFEHIVCRHILDHVEDHKILTNLQHGFRSGRSCETQLITTTHDLLSSFNSKSQIGVAILDFSKAFDTVPHAGLLGKLEHYGIDSKILLWIANFLNNRKQRVVVDGSFSNYADVESGVPQGTVLGPLLFLLHINNLPYCVNSKVRLFADDCLLYREIKNNQDQIDMQRDLFIFFAIMYADDTSLVVNGKDLNALIQLLNTALIDLCTWFKANRLSLNTTKTFYMIFHRARIKHMSGVADSIVMDNTILAKTSSLKYLGVIVDHKLNWIEHISYVRNKVSKGIGIMYKARRFLNKKSLLSLYHSYIYPYLIYCIEVWGCAAPSHLHSLFLLQKKIVRIMTFAPYLAHTEPIFNSLELLPVEKIFINRVSIVMFKFSCNMLPDPIAKLYSKNKDYHSHNTRNKNHLKVPTGTKNFTSNSARIWNTISTKIDVNVTFVQFKANLKLYLLNNVLEFINSNKYNIFLL